MWNRILIGLFFVVLFIGNASGGFGVASPYYEGRNLVLSLGDEFESYFKIQNTIGDTEDIEVEVVLLEGGEVVSLSESRYSVLGGRQVSVPLMIKIPEEDVKDKYNVKVLFRDVSRDVGGGGTIRFNVNVERSFLIEVVDGIQESPDGEKPNEKSGRRNVGLLLGILIFSIILLLNIIVIVLKKRREEDFDEWGRKRIENKINQTL